MIIEDWNEQQLGEFWDHEDYIHNPSGPNIIFHTNPSRGDEISPPPVKCCFLLEMHIFSSYGKRGFKGFSVCGYWWIWLPSQIRFSNVGPFSERIFQADVRFGVEISNI